MASSTVPQLPYPAYGIPFADPTFKTRVTRVTDLSVTPRDGNAVRHNYSRTPPWNNDGSLIMLGGAFLLDARTYEYVGQYSGMSSETFWSQLDPHTLWTFEPTTQSFMRETVFQIGPKQWDTSTVTLRQFPKPDADPYDADDIYEYDEMLMGRYEGRPSRDDRSVAFMARRGSDLYVLLYDIQKNKLISQKSFTGQWPAGQSPRMDWCSVSPSGDFVVMSWTSAAARRGVEVYDRELAYKRTLVDVPQHGDLCLDAAGNEVWVQLLLNEQKSAYQAVIGGFRLDGTQPVIRMMHYPALGSTGGHVSCTNHRRPGWAYVTGQTWYFEVFAIQIKDNGLVEHFAHHHSSNAPPEAAASPDGRQVMFASDWGSASGPVYSYVAEFPPDPPVQILPNASAPAAPIEVILSTATNQLRFYRNTWQAMTATTPRNVELPLTDLFFYATGSDQFSVGYWTQPSTWASSLTFQTRPAANGGATVLIEGRRGGFQKQVYATVYPDDPLVYVVSRLTSTSTMTRVADTQLSFLSLDTSAPQYASTLFVDGTQRSISQSVLGTQSASAYLTNKGATIGVIVAPLNQQRMKVAQPLFLYAPTGGTGVDMRIRGIDGHTLSPGETIELRYAIYWNDGVQHEDVKVKAAKMQAGELNAKFQTP